MNGLVSVRQSKTGRGSALRVFVDVKKHICYAEICKNKYSTLNRDQLESLWCEHLKEGSTATSNAQCVDIDLESFSELNLDKETMDLLESGSKNRVISTYIINSKTTVVPTFGSNDDISLTHVKEDVCPLKGCKRLNNLHTLAKKSSIRLCLHSLLSIRCSPKPVKKQRSITIAKADHRKTVEKLLQQVNEYFPDVGDENFHISLPSNKRFIDEVRY